MKTVISYAQNKEDIILQAFFPDISEGFYVDVGANHPINDSVTKLFYNAGWHGINIEPNKKLHALLEKERPRDINLNIGVADKAGEFSFREYKNHGLSTFSSSMKSDYEKAGEEGTESFTEYTVPVTTLEAIFDEYAAGEVIHFLKIDIEGYEFEALKGNNWKKHRPVMICIESNHIVTDWRPLLKEAGYEKVFFDGLNDYYLAIEYQERQKKFDYPRAMLIGKQVLSFNIYKDISLKDKKNTVLTGMVERQKQHINELRNEKTQLKEQLRRNKRIRHQVKQLAISVDGAILEVIDSLKRKKYPESLTETDFRQTTDVKKLLAIAHEYDNRAFLAANPVKMGLRTVLLFLYRGVRKVISFALKGLWRLAKMAKGRK